MAEDRGRTFSPDNPAEKNKGTTMKRFFVLVAILSLVMPFAIGCEKKAEVKTETTTSTPAGTTTETDTHKVETTK